MSFANNIMTVDVEDWYHVCGVGQRHVVPPRDAWRVRQNIESILELLDRFGQKATFFMLGSVARDVPELAPMIAREGHELASHGFSHRLVTELTPQQFCEELECTERILIEQTGQHPMGYRAPQWSLTERMPWAFSLLQDKGYLYDSSLNPLPFIGNPRGSRMPYKLAGSGDDFWEIPPMVSPSMFGNLPTGGGWGFRFFPLRIIRNTIDRLNGMKQPALFYLHPREIDPGGARLPLNPLKTFVSYGTRKDATDRLKALFERYRFTTIKEYLDNWRPAS